MSTDSRFDVLVIGAGPAGIAAAIEAAKGRGSVGIIDDNPAMGGQIWRGEGSKLSTNGPARHWFQRAADARVKFIAGARVVAFPYPRAVTAETFNRAITIEYNRLILAPGARELFLPFPGWTLPNVLGAGGLQALVKSGLPIGGKRVVVAGSGPLLLAVAAGLRKYGARIRAIVEQAPRSRVFGFGLNLLRSPEKLAQAISLRLVGLRGIPYQLGAWPIEAIGDNRVEAVRMTDGVKTWTIACDYLASGFGLVPNSEVARMFGCECVGRAVRVNDFQATSVESIFCAGETTGIGGVEKSLIEGRIAGLAAIDRFEEAIELFSERAKARKFAEALAKAFKLRPELRELAKPQTIVCRCEDVALGQLRGFDSAREAKLQTRCGMGPCQGRICGPALELLSGWTPDKTRPPVFAARIGSLMEGRGEP